MKICITSSGSTLDSDTDARFGRATGFIIFDTDTGNYEFADNKQNLQSAQGAGIQSAKKIIDSGAEIVITGNVGPKAFSVLESAGIQTYTGAAGTVKKAIDDYKNGRLHKAEGANVEGHW